MRRNHRNISFKSVLLCALFLAAAPASPGSAKAGEISVQPGTTAGELNGSPDFSGSGVGVVIVGKDGAARTGAVQNGDTVLVKDKDGNVTGSYQISLSGAGSGAPSSGSGTGTGPAPDISSGGLSSAGTTAGGGSGAEAPLSRSAGRRGELYLFSGPVTVEELRSQLVSQSGNSALRVAVTAPSGTARSSGPVCTGDTVAVRDASGTEVSSVTAVIPGDLARCGKPTAGGCSVLYDCLTGRRSLSADLAAAADLNRSGGADTADLLLLKKQASEIS